MKNPHIGKPFRLYLFFPQQHICTGLAVKRKLPVAVRFQRNKCQRRVCLICPENAGGIHACILQCVYDIITERIFPQLRDHTAFAAKLCRSRSHICRRTAADTGKGFYFFQQTVTLCRNKINERLAHRQNLFHVTPPYWKNNFQFESGAVSRVSPPPAQTAPSVAMLRHRRRTGR